MQLPPELQAGVMERLQPNEQALAGRLVRRDLGIRLSSNRTAHFRQPLPPAAGDAAWQPHLRQAFKHLTFKAKLRMLSAAAASGSEVNLELAWGLLRPCLHPELLQRTQGFGSPIFYKYRGDDPDPGTAAVRAGHASTVLPWLVHHNCPLDPNSTLAAGAEHCDLAGLRAAWQLLGYGSRAAQGDAAQADAHCVFSTAAGRSGGLQGGNPAIAKLNWLWSVAPAAMLHRHRPQLLAAAAVGAASSGSLPLLTWLQGQGLDLSSTRMCNILLQTWRSMVGLGPPWALALGAALRGGHVAVADWLVDEAGCPLPREEEQALILVWLAAADGGHVESLRWLLHRGVPVYDGSARQAASAGRLEALRFLHTECGAELTEELFGYAAGSGSLPTAAWLLQAGCPMGPGVYLLAARAGDADMVVWLAQEARCPWDQGTIAAVLIHWPRTPWAARRGLQRAVEALEEAGCPPLRVALEAGSDEVQQALDMAAMHGDLWLLRRLHGELGMGLGRRTLAAAAKGGCEAVLVWLVGAGCELGGARNERDVKKYDPYVRAGRRGDLGTLECLVRLGVGFHPQLVLVAARSWVPLPVLRWLVERGAPWVQAAADAVEKVAFSAKVTGRYGDSVAWLEARLGREVWRAVSDSGSGSGSGSEEASGSGSEEGGSGDGSEDESEGWGSEDGMGSEEEGQEAGVWGLGDGSESADDGDGASD